MQYIDVHELADEAKLNKFHGVVLFWSVLILVLDGYDLAVVGVALPSIMKEMGVDPASAGFMASTALFGMMFGAIFLGTAADRIGRRLMICFCVVLFSVGTAAAGLTSDPITFSITRFIAGIGIGGVLPIVTAQMAEFAPRRLRSRLVTLIFVGYSIGGVLVALTGQQLIETHGWQSVFFSALLPVVLVPFIYATMPESMPFLIKNGRTAQLRKIVQRLAPGRPLPNDVQFTVPAEDKAERAPLRQLFSDGRGFSTLMLWLAFIMGLFMVYALSSWLTKLMALAGYSLGSALTFVIVYNVGAMVGSVLGGWLGDKFNLKYVLIAFYAMGALSLTLMGLTKSTGLLFFMTFVVGASTLGTQILANAYAGGFYPMAIRSTGTGFAFGMGRLGAILAPISIGWLVGLNLPLEQNFMVIAAAGVLGMIAVTFIDHRLYASAHHHRHTADGQPIEDGAAARSTGPAH